MPRESGKPGVEHGWRHYPLDGHSVERPKQAVTFELTPLGESAQRAVAAQQRPSLRFGQSKQESKVPPIHAVVSVWLA